jgi:hypothetical protein
MDEEMCLVDSGDTNSILREIKYFQTLTKNKGNDLTIAGRDAVIVGSGRATIMLPMGTSITIEDVLFSLQKTTDMAKIHLKEFSHSRLDCTIHI